MRKGLPDWRFAGAVGGYAVVLRSFASHHSHQFSGITDKTLLLVLILPNYNPAPPNRVGAPTPDFKSA